jgi:hypothetical protein
VKHAVQRGIWVPTQHLLWDRGKPRKTNTLCGQNAVYINSDRTSQETHYVSTTKPNRLMLFREIIAVYCENHTDHINTLCGQNAIYINSVCTLQETHYISTTKPNRLMLFTETVAVYFENHREHINTLCGQNAVYINSVRTS